MNTELHRLTLFMELCQHDLRNMEKCSLEIPCGELRQRTSSVTRFSDITKASPMRSLCPGNRPTLVQFSGKQKIAYHREHSCNSVHSVLSNWRRRKHSVHKGGHLITIQDSFLNESSQERLCHSYRKIFIEHDFFLFLTFYSQASYQLI